MKTLGKLTKIFNKNPKIGANDSYYHVRVKENGKEEDLLLTETMIKNAKYRAKQNPEDCPVSGIFSFDDILIFLLVVLNFILWSLL